MASAADQLNPLDRLAYVGQRGMGALSYEPDLSHYSGDDTPLSHSTGLPRNPLSCSLGKAKKSSRNC